MFSQGRANRPISWIASTTVQGRFIDPVLLLRMDRLPNDGDRWEYQLKCGGYRAIAFKTGGKIHLCTVLYFGLNVMVLVGRDAAFLQVQRTSWH